MLSTRVLSRSVALREAVGVSRRALALKSGEWMPGREMAPAT